jgi:hypothetical protein
MAPQYMSQQLCKLTHELVINTNLDFYNPKKGLKFDRSLKVDKDFGVDDIGDEVSKKSNDNNEIGKEKQFTNVLIKSKF